MNAKPTLELPAHVQDGLRAYVDLLNRWRGITNLISERSFSEVWSRHIHDSVFVQQTCPEARCWLDLGSGAGFPGIVIGVILSAAENGQVYCVESDGRKCAFLRTVVEALRIPVKILNLRIENISTLQIGPVDAVTARAYASIGKIMTDTRAFVDNGAILILPRGKTFASKVESLDLSRYTVATHPNPGHAGGAILAIRQRLRTF